MEHLQTGADGADLATLIGLLSERGIRVGLRDDGLDIAAPKGTLTAELKQRLVQHKAALVRWLRARSGSELPRRPDMRVRLQTQDLRGLPDPEAEMRRLLDADAVEPFDLERGPPLRVGALQLEDEHFVLSINMHHIVGDGRSMDILAQEIGTLYEAERAGIAPELRALPLQYGDYAAWQRDRLDAATLSTLQDFWRDRLGDAPTTHAIPMDRVRPPQPNHAGACVTARLSESSSRAMRVLGRRSDATLFSTMFAAFALAQHRFGGAQDVLVGTVAANRDRVELEGLIGFFVNTVVLRASIDPQQSFRQLLAAAASDVRAAFAHQELPFEQLVDLLKPVRDPAMHPLFQLMFTVVQAADETVVDVPDDAHELRLEPMETATFAKFDLSLAVHDRSDGLHCVLAYATDLFDETSAQRLLAVYADVVDAVSANPDMPLAQLFDDASPTDADAVAQAPVSAATWFERHGIGAVLPVPEQGVHRLFEAQAAVSGDATAVVFGDASISYAQLNARANRLAHALRGLGVGPERLVGLYLPRSIDQLIGVLAIWKAGGAYVPLDPAHPTGRLEAMLSDAQPVAILTHTALVERVPSTSATVLALDAPGASDAQPDTNLDDDGDAQRLAYVLYTSGSTGTPKGVEIMHGALTSLSAAWRHQRGGVSVPGRRVAVNAPMVFDVSVQQILQLLDGATLYPVPEQTRLDIDALWRFLAINRLDEFDCTPSLLQVLLDTMTPERLSHLPKLLLVGGEAISERQWRQLLSLREHGIEACNGYGPTECTVYTTYGPVVPASPLPVIGKPVPNLRLYVLDEHGAPCDVGAAGELCVAGWGVARGYRARPELTAERFVHRTVFGRDERLYRTGDWVRWKDDGTLEYLGRRDGQIKLRGFRIELGEITAALEAQSGVRQAVVIVAGQGAAAQLVAYVVGDVDTDALAQAVAQRLPAYMVPSTWMSLESIPLNTNGKVDTRALPAPTLAVREFVAPQDAVEQGIAAVFEELLEQSPIGIHDNFFALGGHSLLAMRAAVRINQVLGVDLPAYRIFDLATIEKLAPVVRALQDSGPVEAIPRHRGDRRRMPLSQAQQRLWLFDRVVVTRRAAFNIPEHRTILGPLDIDRLRAAFHALIQRHEVLRTRFFEEDDQPWQCVEDTVAFELPLHDLSSDHDAHGTLKALAFEDAQRIFSLGDAPLLRAQLVRLEPERHVLLLDVHHIVSDGLSQEVLWRELSACYRGDPLPALSLQYGDFAVWEHATRPEAPREAALDYWRRTLADLPVCHNLPLACARPAQSGLLATTVRCRVDEPAAVALKELGQQERTTPFMTLLAGFQVLLARSTGDSDIVVGTPVSIRPRAELEGLIGFFVDTLVLRQTIDPSLSFRALLQQVRERVLAAYQHQDVPFEHVVQALAPPRTLSHHPLFQILFSFEPAASGGWQPMPVISEQPPQFDLSMVVREGEALTCNLTYRDDLFAPAAMGELVAQYTRVLAAVAADPDRPLADLAMLDAEDVAWLQAKGSGDVLPVPEQGVHRLFEAQAQASGDATAVVFGDASISYAQLNARANRLAHELRGLSVGPERLVGLYLPRSIDQLIGVLAIWKAGGAYVPLDPAHPTGRLEAMLSDAQPVAILTHAALAERLPSTAAAVLSLDVPGAWDSQPDTNLGDDGDAHRLAYVLYTSGSTGTPKGVEIVHGALTSLSAAWRHQRGGASAPGRRVAVNAPMVFDVSVQQILQLLDGATLYPVPEQTRLDIDALWRFLAASRLDEFDCTPSLLQVLLDTMTPERLQHLPKLLLVGGEAISERQWRQLLSLREHGIEACNGYGPTECTVYTTYGPIVPASPLPVIGKPVPNLRLYVLDEHGAPCDVGAAGELCVAGWGVARGYRARPELTAERFVRRTVFGRDERLYRTGDWVRWKDDGTLEYLGRRDGQIKLRGFRIELGEITAALEAQSGVRQAVVIVAGQGAAAQLVAYVVGDVDTDALAQAVAQRLPAYMVPSTWMSLESIPLNTNGKVDTRALPAPTLAVREFIAPQDAVEQGIAAVFEELLEQSPIGIHDNFFALGGHSLLAMRAAVRINQVLGVDLPAYRIFDLATIEKLAPVVRALQDSGPVEAIPRHRGDRRRMPLSLAQQRLWLVEKMAGGTRGIYNMPMHLRVRGKLDVAALERAFRTLTERHEILRTRFIDHDGQPLQCVEPADGARHAPISFAQHQLWLIDRIEGSVAAGLYNIPLHLRLRGALDADVLEQAFTALIERHEVLRTRFVEIDDEPMQCIDAPYSLELGRHDLRNDPDREARMHDLARADMAQGFDLQHGPLLRAQLLQMADDEHVLLACVHHIVADGWSMDVLAREIGALYEAIAQGRPSPLPALPVQYGDYAHWQRSRRSDPAADVAWWRETLADLPQCHALPTARPRPAQPSHRGATVTHIVSGDVATALQALGQQERATAFMTLLAGFQLLMARSSGSIDIVVGTPVTNRPHPVLEGLIGFFVNTVVLRQQVGASLSFRALLRQVREGVLAAYQHQDVPFEQLVQALRPERSSGHHPLFQLLFSCERAAVQDASGLQLQGLGDSGNGDSGDWAKFDLSLVVREGAELACSLTYASDLFDAADMQRLLAQYALLLKVVSGDPDRPLSELSLLDAEDVAWLQAKGSGDVLPVPEQGVHRLFEAQAQASGDATAVVFGDASISYAQLNARANRLAHELRSLGVGPERLVGLYLPRSIDQLIGVLAIWKAGGAYVPLDPAHPTGRLEAMLSDAQPVAVLTHAALAERLPSTAAAVLTLDSAGAWDSQPDTNLDDDGDAQRLAYVLYTSGSTGTPKGVEIVHGALTSLSAAWRHQRGGISAPGRRVASSAPMVFDMSVQQILQLLDGATIYPVPEQTRLDIEALWQFLAASRLDEFDFTPSLLQVLLDTMTPERIAYLPKLLLVGGEAVSPRLWQQMMSLRDHGIEACNGYGPTECTVYTTYAPVVPASPTPVIGRPVANLRLYVLDEHGTPCAIGAAGELWVAGAGVARGYRARPELTAERFVQRTVFGRDERLYRTGDWVRWKDDGTLEYLGRRDGQIKLRGFRIELGEITAALEAQPGVRQAVVVLAGQGAAAQLVAYIVGDADSDTLAHALGQRLPAYMVPTAWASLDAIPLNINGKVDVRALPALALDEGKRVAPRNASEATIAAIFEELLDHSPIGVHDNFFTLGGHSLLAMRAAVRINQAFGVDLAAYRLFDLATIAQLAPVVQAMQGGSVEAIEPYRGDRSRLPLSQAQQRLWLVEKMAGGTAGLYNIPLHLRLRGALDADVLEHAFTALIERHEVLRTRFVEIDDAPMQCIDAPYSLGLGRHDLRNDPDREARMHALARADMAQGFDLQHGPLLRAQLLQMADDEHVLLACVHHIVADGWSMDVLAREIGALYEAIAQGRPSPLPALPVQYGDYAHWQRSRQNDPAADVAWWRETLADLPQCHALPTARPRPAQPSHRGATVTHIVSGDVATALQALGQQERATAFMTLLAGFQLLVARSSGSIDIVVGTPVTNRPHPVLEGLIGFFVNTVVLRQQVDASLSFRALLRQVREGVLAAYQHQDVPFEQLVQALRPERSSGHHPLFQLLFSCERAAVQDASGLQLQGLGDSGNGDSSDWAKFDLSLVVREGAELACSLTYASDLFDAADMQRLLAQYARLLKVVSGDPDRPLAELSLLDAEDVAWLQAKGSGDVLPVPEQGVHRLFEAQAQASGDATAVVFGDASISYAQLNARANRLAHELRSLGVGPERLVGLYLPRSIDQLIGVLAIWKAGGAYVPLDPAHPTGRLEAMLSDAQPVAVLTHAALAERLPSTAAAVLTLDSADAWDSQPDTNLDDDGDAQRLAYVLYTSGSTGTPKGVEIVHGALTSLSAAWRHQRGGVSAPGRRVAVNAPMVFDVSVQQILQLLDGATLYPVPEQTRLDIDALWRFLATSRLDEFDCTPSLLQVLLDTMTPERLSHLPKLLLVGGEAISERQWRQLLSLREHGIEACNGYGPTECTVYTTYGPVVPASPLPVIGKPVPNLRLYVLDEHGAPCDVGAAGELCVAGWGVARGYRARPELTAERFVHRTVFGRDERLYRTGDWVRWKDDGTLEYLGRRDGQIKLRGFRIELGEITAALEAQSGVRQAVVIVAGQGAAAQLVAYVVGDVDTDALAQAVAQRLPAYMVPSTWMSLESIPLNTNGKVDTRALPAPTLATRAFVAPRNTIEETLQDIWQRVLGHAPIGMHDSFFALGGHSLLAVRMLADVRRAIGRTVTVGRLLGNDDVAGLARMLAADAPQESTSLVTLRTGLAGASPALLVPPVGGGAACYHALAQAFPPHQPVHAGHIDVQEDMPVLDASIADAARRYLDASLERSLDPPDCILGWSMGGVVAHEIAAQMIERGMAAPRVVMIDAHVPRADTDAAPSERYVAATLAAELGLPDAAFAWSDGSGVAGLHALLLDAGLLPDDLDIEQLRRRLHVIRHHLAIAARHVPRRIDAPVTLYKALQTSSLRHDNGWTAHVGQLHVHAVDADHFAIMRGVHAERIARELVTLLAGSHPVVVRPEATADVD